MKKVLCDYCGKPAELVSSKFIYGKDYGHKCYLCRCCNAYVGCHKGTNIPLGRLANAELRYWKKAAHAEFDPLWKYGPFKGKEAYAWLGARMNLPIEKTHIGMFDVEQCKKAIRVIRTERSKSYGKYI